MHEFYLGLAAVGTMVLVLGLLSASIKNGLLSSPMIAMLAGVALGPGLGLLNPQQWGINTETLLEEAARITLAVALMAVALRLPPGFLVRHWRSVTIQVVLGMLLMWLSSALLLYWLLNLSPLLALLVAAVITPTDPVVAGSIVTGNLAKQNVPANLRHAISAESGANDGLAYTFVLLPALLLTRPAGEAWSHWLTHTVLLDVGGALLFGIALGLSSGHLLRAAEARRTLEEHSFLAHTLALSLLALAGARLLGLDGILAVFATGIAFDYVASASDRAEEEKVQEAFNQFFMLPVFVLFGLMLPWEKWLGLGWTAAALVAAVLLLRRLPAFLLIHPLIRTLHGTRDAAFAGWFGPIGVATLFYAILARSQTGEEIAWTVASLVVFASLLVHGVTASPFTRLYGRHRDKEDQDPPRQPEQ